MATIGQFWQFYKARNGRTVTIEPMNDMQCHCPGCAAWWLQTIVAADLEPFVGRRLGQTIVLPAGETGEHYEKVYRLVTVRHGETAAILWENRHI